MSLMIPAESVQLEANLREPKGTPMGAAVICHPHPVHGGTMDNRIVFRAAKAASEAGFAALRFNFRGVGLSTGQYDQGIGEKEDVIAAIRWIENKFPSLPVVLLGYSFGAWVGLQVGCMESRVKAMVGVAVPLDLYEFDFLATNSKPALYIAATRDEFCSQENLARFESRLPATSSLRRIEGADHFFSDQIEIVESLVSDFFQWLPREQRTA
jgi:uncharacterized protein